MRISLLGRFALCASAAIALLAGCGPQQAQLPGSVFSQTQSVARDSDVGSWMLPEARNEDLLYVSAYSNVLVFTYPAGKQVGDLKGFYSAAGECVDSKGNVFVGNDRPSGVYEYAHGGTKRIAFFRSGTAGARACAISPTTGDLAICGFSSHVYIYKAARGRHPVTLTDERMQYGTLDTYDDHGNLFFIGLKLGNKQQLSELPSGSSHFINIKADAAVYVEGGLQWNDGLLTAVSNTKQPNIYQFQINGTKAHKVGATPLGSPAYIVLQYVIDGKTVIVPNLLRSTHSNVLYYKYPEGGLPTFTLPRSGGARAVALSRAAS